MSQFRSVENTSRPFLIAEMPGHERPRERFLRHGADALSDTELLAILLRTGQAGRSVLELAREALIRFDGDLRQLATAPLSELQQIPGIGQAKAIEVSAAFTLARRLSNRCHLDRPRLESPAEVVTLMREYFMGKAQEEFHVLLLDTKHHLIRDEQITVGLVDRSQVHAREVFRSAIKESCSRIVLVHNHPSGDPTPSAQDISCTKNLIAAGKIIGIEVLDHIIIGHRTASRFRDFLSLRDEKLI
jgi:DNA repair protein RadC